LLGRIATITVTMGVEQCFLETEFGTDNQSSSRASSSIAGARSPPQRSTPFLRSGSQSSARQNRQQTVLIAQGNIE
jgi:hypothetical protein